MKEHVYLLVQIILMEIKIMDLAMLVLIPIVRDVMDLRERYACLENL